MIIRITISLKQIDKVNYPSNWYIILSKTRIFGFPTSFVCLRCLFRINTTVSTHWRRCAISCWIPWSTLMAWCPGPGGNLCSSIYSHYKTRFQGPSSPPVSLLHVTSGCVSISGAPSPAMSYGIPCCEKQLLAALAPTPSRLLFLY